LGKYLHACKHLISINLIAQLTACSSELMTYPTMTLLLEARLWMGPTGDDMALFASSTAAQATDARMEETFILG
jgi:hypothetical protein